MICVDTSVWVDFFRGTHSSLVSELNELLEDDSVCLAVPVWIEILSGASKKDKERLGKALSALPRLYPQRSTWKLVEQWIKKASPKGETFGMGDLLIAAIASENNAKIWSLDADFSRMAQLKFIQLY
ncbi:MAG: PIN domain-containing protein [Deltaproteobacteria bacterium]|nr:PIN domain-containing protein [Deltaproteobacteria bacterium]